MMLNTMNTISPSFLSSHEEKQNARAKKYRMEILDTFPNIHTIQEYTYWGVFSWSLTKSKVRLLKRKGVIDVGFGPCTIGDIARDYLDTYYPNRLRATANQKAAILRHRSAPLYLAPGGCKDMSYVDLSAAYFSIMCRFGWDVDYFPGRWIAKGRSVCDFPLPNHKSARNILVSTGISSHNVVWNGAYFERVYATNTHINFGLWALIQDILHIVASIAIECGAFYVHTDGYLLPTKTSAPLIQCIHDLHLNYKIKARGSGWVWGFGNYKCGDKTTQQLRPVKRPRPYNGVFLPEPEVIRRIFKSR